MADAFESLLIEAQANQTETLVDQLSADFVGLTVSVADMGAQGLFSHWFSHHFPKQIVAGLSIHHPSILIRPLGLSPKDIQAHGKTSDATIEQVSQKIRHLTAAQLGLALGEYNDDHRCFYVGISHANHTESVAVPISEKPAAPTMDTVLGSATLVHYYMRRVRNRHSDL
jgi:hypothetical protein